MRRKRVGKPAAKQCFIQRAKRPALALAAHKPLFTRIPLARAVQVIKPATPNLVQRPDGFQRSSGYFRIPGLFGGRPVHKIRQQEIGKLLFRVSQAQHGEMAYHCQRLFPPR